MPGLGERQGLVMMPEVGDEVLVGFEFGDVRRAYVLGGARDEQDGVGARPRRGRGQARASPAAGRQARPGQPAGHKILIDDDCRNLPQPQRLRHHDRQRRRQGQRAPRRRRQEAVDRVRRVDAAGEDRDQAERQRGGIVDRAGRHRRHDRASRAPGNVTVEAAAPGSLTLKGGAGVKIDGGSGIVELSGSHGEAELRWDDR